MKRNDDELINYARAALDRSLEQIDSVTSARLRQARQQAVAQAERRHGVIESRSYWAPAAALFSGAVVALLLWLQPIDAPPPPSLIAEHPADLLEPESVDELELIASIEEIELYEELEFYLWLAEVDHDES